MSRLVSAVVLTAAVVWLTGVAAVAQQTNTSSETKNFEILGVAAAVITSIVGAAIGPGGSS